MINLKSKIAPETPVRFSFFSFDKGERYVVFSPTRKRRKESLRLPPQTPIHLLESNTHGSKVLQCSRSSHRPPLAARQATAAGKSAPAGARRAPRERPLARYLQKRRRPADHASPTSVDAVFYSRHRTAVSRTNGQAGGLRLLFVLFLSEQEKNMFLSAFLTEEKSTKRLIEATASNSHSSAGKQYPRLEGVAVLARLAQATTPRAESNCGWEVCARRRKARAV